MRFAEAFGDYMNTTGVNRPLNEEKGMTHASNGSVQKNKTRFLN